MKFIKKSFLLAVIMGLCAQSAVQAFFPLPSVAKAITSLWAKPESKAVIAIGVGAFLLSMYWQYNAKSTVTLQKTSDDQKTTFILKKRIINIHSFETKEDIVAYIKQNLPNLRIQKNIYNVFINEIQCNFQITGDDLYPTDDEILEKNVYFVTGNNQKTECFEKEELSRLGLKNTIARRLPSCGGTWELYVESKMIYQGEA